MFQKPQFGRRVIFTVERGRIYGDESSDKAFVPGHERLRDISSERLPCKYARAAAFLFKYLPQIRGKVIHGKTQAERSRFSMCRRVPDKAIP